MQITREFVYIDEYKDKNYKNSGWLLVNKPHFDPVAIHRAHVLIHDVMEHHNDDGDGIEAEFMALGATYFIRVFGGWSLFKRRHASDGELAQYNDIVYFLELNKYQIKNIKGDVHPDLQDYYERAEAKFKENNPNITAKYPHVIRTSFKWLSKGYTRATHRWAGHTPQDVLTKLWEPMWMHFNDDWNDPSFDRRFRQHGNKLVFIFDTVTLDYHIIVSGIKKVNGDLVPVSHEVISNNKELEIGPLPEAFLVHVKRIKKKRTKKVA